MKCARLQDAHLGVCPLRSRLRCLSSHAKRETGDLSIETLAACLSRLGAAVGDRASVDRASISAHAELRVRLRRSKRYYRRDKVLVCLGYGPLLTRGAASNLDEDERRRDRCNVVVRDTNLHHAFRQQANLLEVCLWRHSHRPDFVRDALQRASLAKNLLWRSLAVR